MVDKCERIMDAMIENELVNVYHFNSYKKYMKVTEKAVIEDEQRLIDGNSQTDEYVRTFFRGNVPNQSKEMLERNRKKWA